MKCKIEFECELPEDASFLLDLAHISDIKLAMDEAYQMIRSRVKYVEDIGDDESDFLEQVMHVMTVEGVDI